MRLLAFGLLLFGAPLLAQAKSKTVCRTDYTGKVICETTETKAAPSYGAAFDSLRARRERRATAEAGQRASADERRRERVRFDLYARRASAILLDMAASLQVDSVQRESFITDGKEVILQLYDVSPMASNADIHDALYPVLRKYRKT